ncbi:hypothetical protein WKK05_12890 [Nostoc sp. UHCC 0302]|uniref:hypothetical protein n=1 Tax=Nostoc sp. UHCC 0302 TaxID=3134896 RepID=UPI00311CB8F9
MLSAWQHKLPEKVIRGGAFYRRLRSHLGASKAITATAHKLTRLFYPIWTTTEEYSESWYGLL